MARSYLTLFCVLLVVSLTMATIVTRKCIENKSFFDGCNNCMCSNGAIACTMMACEIYDPVTGETKPAPTLEPPEDFWEPVRNVDPPRA